MQCGTSCPLSDFSAASGGVLAPCKPSKLLNDFFHNSDTPHSVSHCYSLHPSCSPLHQSASLFYFSLFFVSPHAFNSNHYWVHLFCMSIQNAEDSLSLCSDKGHTNMLKIKYIQHQNQHKRKVIRKESTFYFMADCVAVFSLSVCVRQVLKRPDESEKRRVQS